MFLRRFDGIGIKCENNKIKYSFACGLNAKNSIPNKPSKIQLGLLPGDDTKLNESNLSSKR